jgi:hypothetical protein
MASDPFQPFRELMIPLSGVVKMHLLQRGDKKIFLIGEMHTPVFCRDKGFTPLCSIIEEYLRTRTEPVDFMIETDNEIDRQVPPLEETRENCSTQRVNHDENIIQLVRDMVAQYIPPVRKSVLSFPPRTVVELPNARVHWLDPTLSPPRTKADWLFHYMIQNVDLYYDIVNENAGEAFSHNQLTSLYISRTFINDLLDIQPDSPEASWALPEPSVIHTYETQGHLDTIPGRELFLQSDESSKISFFKKVYDVLADAKFFKKCYSGDRLIEWGILQTVFTRLWREYNPVNSTIEHFYYTLTRFFMDFFTCCRILKEEGRWYKNIVIYAGATHTTNIGRILLLLGFRMVPLPVISYNPNCSETGGKSRKQRRKKRKTRR